MKLSFEEYSKLRKILRTPRDLDRLKYPRGTLYSILIQKRIEIVKSTYYRFNERIEEIVNYWSRYKRLPRWLRLPPVLKVKLLMKGFGFTDNEIKRALRNPELADDLSEVLLRAIKNDYVYSPIAIRIQESRGILAEKAVEHKLKTLCIDFKRERDLNFKKTPDFYFEEPIRIKDLTLNWIECKALFGDFETHLRYYRRQYRDYNKIFGRGAVVYMSGHLNGIKGVLDCENFRNMYSRALAEMKVYITDNADESVAQELNVRFLELKSDPINSAIRVAEEFSNGIILALHEDYRNLGRVLKNMGFKVVYL